MNCVGIPFVSAPFRIFSFSLVIIINSSETNNDNYNDNNQGNSVSIKDNDCKRVNSQRRWRSFDLEKHN